jgi:hypothetical protein
LYYRNIGRTPAVKQWIGVRLFSYHPPKGTKEFRQATVKHFLADKFRQMRKQESVAREEAAHAPEIEVDVAPGDSTFVSNQDFPEDAVSLSKDDFAGIQQPVPTNVLFFIGLSTYMDAFANIYETEYCWFYFGSDVVVWHKCPTHNSIK